jgi:L-alanine-DL-glutamate epimerase-like enolase superfamily enzyme
VTTINGVGTRVYTVPLPQPESDGTLAWRATTVVAALVEAGGQTGLGWTYAPAAAGAVIGEILAPMVTGLSAFDIGRAHLRMRQASRNAPTAGLVSLAISAVDVALWDLKARLLGVPLTHLFGRVRRQIPLYGSGGFTSMTERQLRDQLSGWVTRDGMTAVKIKVGEDRGRHVDRDLRRIALARETIGPDVALMIDANGGYDTKQAVRVAHDSAGARVSWFEGPVSSDRLGDLALLRGMVTPEVTAGEYGTTLDYFGRMCAAGAVDCLQVDATRCGGYTGMIAAAAVADSYGLQVSTHCAPHLHAAACAAIPNLRHAEYFADHAHADGLLFDGVTRPVRGRLATQDDRPGHGITLREGAEKLRTN